MPLNTLELKEKVEQDETIRKDQKIRPRSKLFILFWTLLILLAVSVCLKSMIEDQAGTQITLSSSIENLLTVLNKQITFSAIVISYFDKVAYNASADLFYKNLNKYNTLENNQISFEETSYPEFQNFTKNLQQVTYVYVCEFVACNDTYKDYVNIIYYSIIHKLALYMEQNLGPGPTAQNAF